MTESGPKVLTHLHLEGAYSFRTSNTEHVFHEVRVLTHAELNLLEETTKTELSPPSSI
jgi:hypothetical protein